MAMDKRSEGEAGATGCEERWGKERSCEARAVLRLQRVCVHTYRAQIMYCQRGA